jgi:hypothetical protein
MPGPIALSMNSDRKSLNFSFRSRIGVRRKVSLSAAEVSDLLQELGRARLTMIPPQQFAPKPADKRPSTKNPSVHVTAGPKAGSLVLSLLDVKYGWLGFGFRAQSWHALVRQASDALAEADTTRSAAPE